MHGPLRSSTSTRGPSGPSPSRRPDHQETSGIEARGGPTTVTEPRSPSASTARAPIVRPSTRCSNLSAPNLRLRPPASTKPSVRPRTVPTVPLARWHTVHMAVFGLDPQAAQDIALGTVGGSILIGLLVLKFVKSLVTKLLLVIVCGVVAVAAFDQRDNVSVCVERARVAIAEGSAAGASCTLFGQTVTVPSIPGSGG